MCPQSGQAGASPIISPRTSCTVVTEFEVASVVFKASTSLTFVTKIKEADEQEIIETVSNSVTTVQEVLGDMMGDAPACPDCGHITIRNGSCYKCLNCGNSLGCS